MSDGAQHLERVRRMCARLPGASERLSHGEPTFFVRKRVFAMYSNNHHNDGHIAVLIPAAPGVQELLIATRPAQYFRPAYVGVRGWVGIDLDQTSDTELAQHLLDGWRMMAPKQGRGQA